MAEKEIPVPLKRFTEAYDLEIKEVGRFSDWLRRLRWNSAFKEAKEADLSQNAIGLLDVFNAFMTATTPSSKWRAIAYQRVAWITHRLDEETIELWKKVLVKEFSALLDTYGSELEKKWDDCKFFHRFYNECDLSRYSEYWYGEGAIRTLPNLIRLSGPRDRHTGVPLIFKSKTKELLSPHYNINREMSSLEIAEAEGIIRLHYAWKTNDDSEKQKIKRFVAAYVDEMDAAIGIVESRFVNTLEELDSLMHQTSKTPALSQGAL